MANTMEQAARTALKNPSNDGAPVYLDYQATTPTDPRVVETMLPHFNARFGNPHSRNHAYGWRAEEAVEHAREQIANLIKANPKEIIFTVCPRAKNSLDKFCAYCAGPPIWGGRRGVAIKIRRGRTLLPEI